MRLLCRFILLQTVFKGGEPNLLKNNILKIKSRVGFTLIELLVVIGVLGVIAAGVVALIDPVDKLAQANDAKAQNDVSQIATALQSYAAQNNGLYPTSAEYSAGTSVLVSSGELSVMPVATTGYSYVYSVNGTQTGAKVTATQKAKKNTASAAGTFCWDSAVGAGVYKLAATTNLGVCP